MPETRHTVTAQLPPDLFAKVKELHKQFPGVTLHQLTKACLAMSTEVELEMIRKYLGRF